MWRAGTDESFRLALSQGKAGNPQTLATDFGCALMVLAAHRDWLPLHQLGRVLPTRELWIEACLVQLIQGVHTYGHIQVCGCRPFVPTKKRRQRYG